MNNNHHLMLGWLGQIKPQKTGIDLLSRHLKKVDEAFVLKGGLSKKSDGTTRTPESKAKLETNLKGLIKMAIEAERAARQNPKAKHESSTLSRRQHANRIWDSLKAKGVRIENMYSEKHPFDAIFSANPPSDIKLHVSMSDTKREQKTRESAGARSSALSLKRRGLSAAPKQPKPQEFKQSDFNWN